MAAHAPIHLSAHTAAVGQDVYIFGGHVLVTADEHGKKRRHFFNDLWKVDTVRCERIDHYHQ